MTLRQEIEKWVAIASGTIPCDEETETDLCKINTTLACNRCCTDRICEAIDKAAEGTPKRSTILIHTGNDRFVVPTLETRKQLQQIEDAEKEYLSECQAYWRKQVE